MARDSVASSSRSGTAAIHTRVVDVLHTDKVSLARGSDDHRRGGDAIDAARDAGCGVEERFERVVVEEGCDFAPAASRRRRT